MSKTDISVTVETGAATKNEIKLGRLSRDMTATQIEVRKADDGTRLSFPASSEEPVERYFGTEVLSHKNGAVRMERFDRGAAPLLFNHDWSDPVGMIDGASLRDGRLYVDAHLFDTARGAEVGAMIRGGLRNVSIGYEIEEMAETEKGRTYTATRWTPLEVSIVTVPADSSVGIGRQADEQAKPVRILRAESEPVARAASPGVPTMAENQAAAGQAVADSNIVVVNDYTGSKSIEQMEAERKEAIISFARGANCDDRYVQHWIRSGASLPEVARQIDKIQQERAKDTNAATFLDVPKKELSNYSLTRALRAATSKNWSNAGLELEAHKEVSKRLNRLPKSDTSFFVPLDALMTSRRSQTRDMTVAGVSGSNYLVSTDNLAGSFIELLRNTSVTMRMGITRLAGLQGNVTIPKMTAGNTAYWLADENTQITESQPTIGQLSLTPKNVAAMTELSHLLMQQSSPDVEQLVLNSIARDIALAVDVGVLRGSGNSGQPLGIVGTGSIGAFTGGSLGAPGILNAISDVAAANALNDGCGFVTTPAVAALLMDEPNVTGATDGTPLWQGRMENGTIRGYAAVASNQMASATALFGWWPSIVLGEWGVLELMVNPFSDFTRGLTAVRGWYTCDVGVRYPGAFTYASSIT